MIKEIKKDENELWDILRIEFNRKKRKIKKGGNEKYWVNNIEREK